MTTLTDLECSACGKRYDAREARNLCTCGGPLLVRYDLEAARSGWSREWIEHGPTSIWRYTPVLPVRNPNSIVSLGEGLTPLVRTRRMGFTNAWIKDEGLNPTGSVKARGLSCAVSMAVELGIRKVAISSAGNAGSALAAYAAAAGIEAHIFLPRDVPQANYVDCQAYGAHVVLIDGLIGDCQRAVSEGAAREGWFDMGTLCEPYRLEGMKTMGYELAEDMNWQLPDAILYPIGGGVGLIGMWKAFEELQALGWVVARRPKMIAVQAAGCQPVVRAFESGAEKCEPWPNAATVASGLRVPKPLGDFLILRALRESGGTAVAVSDAELVDAGVRLATQEGIFASPEGAACVAALTKLVACGFVAPDEKLVIYNTGSGLKYLDTYSRRFPRAGGGEQDKLGGLITPR